MVVFLKTINAELAKGGFKASLTKGGGYFYFTEVKPLIGWTAPCECRLCTP